MITTKNAERAVPISLFTDAIAATHGVYNRVNTKNTSAENGVNKVFNALISPPNKTVSVLTTLSFAVNPVISAVEILQSPNPSGTKTGAANPPINASRLSLESTTTFSRTSNVCKNQMTIDAMKIIVNAFVIKSFALSQINIPTLFKLGRR